MPLSLVENWLTNAGYDHHCFISYPNSNSRIIRDCVERLGRLIEDELGLRMHKPSVFLDKQAIRGGDIWEKSMGRALCRSISMVALCIPPYYMAEHKWCGREWQTMHQLGAQRLPNEQFKLIIPLLLRKDDTLPAAVAATQYIDISGVTTTGRSYYQTKDFRKKVAQVADRIEQIADVLARDNIVPTCDSFSIVKTSAFNDYQSKAQPFPFRSGS